MPTFKQALTNNLRRTIKKPWSFPGFGQGAYVTTAFGNCPVQSLGLNDPIKTQDGRFLSVRHIDTIYLDRRFLIDHPDAQPVEIPQGALSFNIPNQPTLVSGMQRVFRPGRNDQEFGTEALNLVGIGTVHRNLHGHFTYYVFHCGEPCTACINGLWVHIDPEILPSRRA